VLRRVVPFDGAWLALTDPCHPNYTTLASADLAASTVRFLAGPLMAHDIETTGSHRAGPPLSPSDLPYPAVELATWADCLVPAGIHEALAVALIAGGRHVGFLALLWGDETPPSTSARRALGRLAPLLARALDPMPSLVAAASLVEGATAGLVLWADGESATLPGLADHPLLALGSAVPALARAQIQEGRAYCSFLWPVGGRRAPGGHLRVTVLAITEPVPLHVVGMVLLSPPGDLRGLTPRELEVLGLLIDGGSNAQIAHALVVAQRTVAAHLEHIMIKLSAPSRTLAAVRAERAGLYVPCEAAGA
jgi:DNA-binding CsgD family transcriptional regulator